MRRFLCGVLTIAVAASAAVAWAGNQETADQIASNLKHYGELTGRYSLDVGVEDGVATLSGWFSEQQQIDRVVEVVRRTPGVTLVRTDLTVRHTAQPVAGSTTDGRVTQTAMRPQFDSYTHETVNPVEISAASNTAPVARMPMNATVTTRPMPLSAATTQPVAGGQAMLMQPVAGGQSVAQTPLPMGGAAAQLEQPNLPQYAWPSYAAYPNYAGVTYPKKYDANCFPNIGPFYPYPDVPAEWRKVTLEWHDGYWYLDFDDGSTRNGVFSGLFRPFH